MNAHGRRLMLLLTGSAAALAVAISSPHADSTMKNDGGSQLEPPTQAADTADAPGADAAAEGGSAGQAIADSVDAGSNGVTSDDGANAAEADAGASGEASASADADDQSAEDGGAVAGDTVAGDDDATAHSKSFTKSIVTPHMVMSITHSIGKVQNQDGDMAMAKAFAKAMALDTPGQTRTDTMTKTSVKVEGDAEADAAATADASVGDAGMSAETFGETSVAVH